MVRSSSILALMAGALSVSAFVGCSASEDPGGGGAGSGAQAGTPVGTSGSAGAPSGGTSGASPTGGAGGSSPGGVGGIPASGSGGAAGASGAGMGGGASGNGGIGGAAGMAGGGGSAGSGGAAGSAGSGGGGGKVFSFFVSSMKAMQQLSGNEKGFGGDLRFGKADGLTGADEICRQTAELGQPGAGARQWRAFLSAAGPPAVSARDRIGPGPWYDRNLRLVAANVTDLLAAARPKGDAMIINDLPNERGEPNHYVGANGHTPNTQWDTHDILTGSKADGTVYGGKTATCNDWTSAASTAGEPRIGHSWPRTAGSTFGAQFASDHNARGCTPGYNLSLSNGGGTGDCVGCGGGYGGIYCFALP